MQIPLNRNQIFKTYYKIRKDIYKSNKNQDNIRMAYTN